MTDFTPTTSGRLARLERDNADLRSQLHAIYSQRFPRIVASGDVLGVRVHHVGTENCPPWGLMRIVGVDDTGSERVITVDKPNSTFERHYLVNGPKELPYGEYGTGYWAFDHRTRIKLYAGDTVGTPGQSFGAVPNQWYAQRGYYGFRSLGKRYTEEGKLSFVGMQLFHYTLKGKLDSAIAKAASGTVSVWLGDFAADTNFNLTARQDAMTSVTTGKKCGVRWDADTATIDWAEC